MGFILDAFRLLAKGGVVMIPLLFCSLVSVAILVERHIKIKHAQVDISDHVRRAEDALYSGKPSKALEILSGVESPVARVLSAGIRNSHLGERCAERSMEEQGTRELSYLNRHLGYLDTIITIAPLLGLLGTVTGMISAFHVIAAKDGISTPTAITGGVAEALVATATGLAIAIFTLIGYNMLQERIKSVVVDLETGGTAMTNALTETREIKGEITSLSA